MYYHKNILILIVSYIKITKDINIRTLKGFLCIIIRLKIFDKTIALLIILIKIFIFNITYFNYSYLYLYIFQFVKIFLRNLHKPKTNCISYIKVLSKIHNMYVYG